MSIVVSKDMGLTHDEFYRSFAMLAGDATWQVVDHVITLEHATGPITIRLEPERRRTIAQVSLPATTLHLEFTWQSADEVDAFIKQFDRCFRRGGG